MGERKIILNMIYDRQMERFKLDFKFRAQESTVKIHKLDIEKNLLQGNKLDSFLELLLYEEENLSRVAEYIKLVKYSIHEFVKHQVSISATDSYISKQVEICINENSPSELMANLESTMQLKLNCVRLSDEIEVIRFVNDEKICRENIINIQQIDLGEEGFSWVLWYMKMQKINKDEL